MSDPDEPSFSEVMEREEPSPRMTARLLVRDLILFPTLGGVSAAIVGIVAFRDIRPAIAIAPVFGVILGLIFGAAILSFTRSEPLWRVGAYTMSGTILFGWLPSLIGREAGLLAAPVLAPLGFWCGFGILGYRMLGKDTEANRD